MFPRFKFNAYAQLLSPFIKQTRHTPLSQEARLIQALLARGFLKLSLIV